MTEPDRPPATALQMWITWTALLVSLGVYGLLGLVIARPKSGDAALESVMLAVLGAAALATAIGTLVARDRLLVRPARRGELDVRSKAGLERFWVISLLTWVLSESIGIYGLVLFLLFGRPSHLYGFLAVAIALMIAHAPRVAALRPASSSDLAQPTIKIG